MNNRIAQVMGIVVTLLLGACASAPKIDTTGIDATLTPQRAVAEVDAVTNQRVLWGGVILASQNLKDVTQIEVLAYPLNKRHKPDLDRNPLGRFLVRYPGYLETTDYAQGRLLTVVGTLQELHSGRIGESDYTYPVVSGEEAHLWQLPGRSGETRFQFGVGVMIHN